MMKTHYFSLLTLGTLTAWIPTLPARSAPIDFELLEGRNIEVLVADDVIRLHGATYYHDEGEGSWSKDMVGEDIRVRFRTGEPLAVALYQQMALSWPSHRTYLLVDAFGEVDFQGHLDVPGDPPDSLNFHYWISPLGGGDGEVFDEQTGTLNPGTHFAELYWGFSGYLNESDLPWDEDENPILEPWAFDCFSEFTLELRRVPMADTGSPWILLGLSLPALLVVRHFGKAKAT